MYAMNTYYVEDRSSTDFTTNCCLFILLYLVIYRYYPKKIVHTIY